MKKHASETNNTIYEQEVLSYIAFQQPRHSYQSFSDQVIKPRFLRQMEHFYLDQVIRFLSGVTAIFSALHAVHNYARQCWNERVMVIWSGYKSHWAAHKRQRMGEFAAIALTAAALGLYLGAH